MLLSFIKLIWLEDEEPPPLQDAIKIEMNIRILIKLLNRFNYFNSKLSDNDFISLLNTNIAIRFGIDTRATTT